MMMAAMEDMLMVTTASLKFGPGRVGEGGGKVKWLTPEIWTVGSKVLPSVGRKAPTRFLFVGEWHHSSTGGVNTNPTI